MTSDALWEEIGKTINKARKQHGRNEVARIADTFDLLQYQILELDQIHRQEFEEQHGKQPPTFYKKTTNPTAKIINAVKKVASQFNLQNYEWQKIATQVYIHLAPDMNKLKTANLQRENINVKIEITAKCT